MLILSSFICFRTFGISRQWSVEGEVHDDLQPKWLHDISSHYGLLTRSIQAFTFAYWWFRQVNCSVFATGFGCTFHKISRLQLSDLEVSMSCENQGTILSQTGLPELRVTLDWNLVRFLSTTSCHPYARVVATTFGGHYPKKVGIY